MRYTSLTFDAAPSARSVDENGFLHVASSHITKATVNPYYGREIPGCERLGLDPERIYYGFRDPEELRRSLPTWEGLPLHIEHHPDSADAPEKLTRVGAVGKAVWNAPYVDAPLTVWDGEAIDAIEDGSFRELSCAYRYEPDFTPGQYEGVEYDFIMRNIRGNHVALVEEGRAGPDVVVADAALAEDAAEWRTAKNGKKYQIDAETGEITKGNLGQKDDEHFGPVFSAFRGKPSEAIEHLLKEKKGHVPGAFHKEGLGDIDLPYGEGGKKGFGLAHIIERRNAQGMNGEAFVRQLPTLVKEGKIEKRESYPGRAYIVHEKMEAAIRLDWNGKERNWMVTAYPIKREVPGAQDGCRTCVLTFDDRQSFPLPYAGGTGKNIWSKAIKVNRTGGLMSKLKNWFRGARDASPDIERQEVDLAQAIIDLHKVDPETGEIVDITEDEDKAAEIRKLIGELAGKLEPEEVKKLTDAMTDLAYSRATGDADPDDRGAAIERILAAVLDLTPEQREKLRNSTLVICGFNPRLRAGGDRRIVLHLANCFDVSIHASAREATGYVPFARLSMATFQSTPPRGRRLPPARPWRNNAKFQSTPPRGRRLYVKGHEQEGPEVSIHASAREATRDALAGAADRRSFNPRLRAGGDSMLSANSISSSSFNPRLRAGGDISGIINANDIDGFNPRLRAGGDISGIINANDIDGFNPRLRAGGDHVFLAKRSAESAVSIHASAREATTHCVKNAVPHMFQSTPPRGRRRRRSRRS